MKDLIDPWQVGAQILGFLILLWGMKKFAWGPILGTLEARRQKIAGEFAAAEKLQADATDLKSRYESELRGIDAQARVRIQEAVTEGQRAAAEIKAQAQHDAQQRLERAVEDIQREREKAKEMLKEQVVALSMRTAEKILRTKLDDPAQRKLVGEFVDEVSALK